MTRTVNQSFKALRPPRSAASCTYFEGSSLEGDVQVVANGPVVNDSLPPSTEIVNGIQVVRFRYSADLYCVAKSIFDASTEPVAPAQPGESKW